jgi:AraC-like DNA-binding protein
MGAVLNHKQSFLLIIILIHFVSENIHPFDKTMNNFPKSSAVSIQETGLPYIKKIGADEYGAHPKNWCIIEDQAGIIYVGNSHGVLVFDGTYWELIPVANHSFVRSLAVDALGVIYVGAINEFGYLTRNERGKLTYQSLVDMLPADQRNTGNIWNTHATSHGIYFFTGKIMYHYYKNSIQLIPYHLNLFSACMEDKIFAGNDAGKIIMIKKGAVTELLLPGNVLGENPGIIQLVSFKPGSMLIATMNNGYFVFNYQMLLDENDEFQSDLSKQNPRDVIHQLSTPLNTDLSKYDLYCAARIREDLYAFGFSGGGVVLINGTGRIISRFTKKSGITDNIIWSLFCDRYQNLWIASDNGLSYVELNSPVSRFSEANGLNETPIFVIRHQHLLYVGTMLGVYYLNHPAETESDSIALFKPVPNLQSGCWDFVSVGNSLLVAAGRDGVAEIIHKKARIVAQQVGYVYSIAQTKKLPNYVFLGSRNGLFALEQSQSETAGGKSEFALSKKYIFPEITDIIRFIESDDNGNLWLVAKYNGLIHLRFLGEHPDKYETFRYNETNGLPGPFINGLCQWENKILAATFQGIYQTEIDATLQKGKQEFSKWLAFEQKTGISPCFVEVIQPGIESEIWVSSNLGIGSFKLNHANHYQWQESLFKTIDCRRLYNFLIEKENIVWITTDTGLYRLDSSIKNKYDIPFQTMIRRVEENQQVYYNPTLDSAAKKNDNALSLARKQSQPLKIRYSHRNSITFYYAANFYLNYHKNLFSYYLQGYDQTWSTWVRDAKKEYTNLPPKDYCFLVKAKNTNNYESTTAAYCFQILPPWYQTIYAYLFYGLAIAALVIFAFVFHFRQLNKVVLRQQQAVDRVHLTAQKTELHIKHLLEFMETKKPYLNPELNIHLLSDQVNIPKYQLSHIINNRLNLNFNDFVNRYRIKESTGILADPKKDDQAMLDVAFEVGFNHKSTFNMVFKKVMKMTPSDYRKQELLKKKNQPLK